MPKTFPLAVGRVVFGSSQRSLSEWQDRMTSYLSTEAGVIMLYTLILGEFCPFYTVNGGGREPQKEMERPRPQSPFSHNLTVSTVKNCPQLVLIRREPFT